MRGVRMYEGFIPHLCGPAISRVHASSSVIPSSVAEREADERRVDERAHVVTCSATFWIFVVDCDVLQAAAAAARNRMLTCSAAARWVNMNRNLHRDGEH